MRLPLLLSVLSATCFAADQVETPTPPTSGSTTAAAIVPVAPSPAVDELTAMKAKLAALEAKSAADKAAAEAKALTPTYKPGVICRVFMPAADGAKFPPDGWMLSEWSLVESFSAPQIPTVDGFVEAGKPNHLVASRNGSLDGALFYSVQFSGYFYAAEAGDYTFSVRSDDPVQIQIADRVVAISKFSVPNPITRSRADAYGVWGLAEPAKLLGVAGGMFAAQSGRYYPCTVTSWQRYRIGLAQDWRQNNCPDRGVEVFPNELPAEMQALADKLTGPVCGATLSVSVIAPNATDTRPVKLYLLAKPSPEKKP